MFYKTNIAQTGNIFVLVNVGNSFACYNSCQNWYVQILTKTGNVLLGAVVSKIGMFYKTNTSNWLKWHILLYK